MWTYRLAAAAPAVAPPPKHPAVPEQSLPAGPVMPSLVGDFSAVPVSVARSPSPQEVREVVQGAVRFLRESAEWSAQAHQLPALERLLRLWQRIVEDHERLVLDVLGGDPALFRGLRTAYRSALTGLVGAAARLGGEPAAVLYERHRALIPEWAFPTEQLPGITTPLPLGTRQDRQGTAEFRVNGVRVVVLPDLGGRNRNSTSLHFRYPYIPPWPNDGKVITGRRPMPEPSLRIRTTYARGADPGGPSGYGRGTTQADVAAGDTTLRFHESRHGADALRFVREHPLPRFTGGVGMTVAAWQRAAAAYQRELARYGDELIADTTRRTDCAGKTIDTYNAEHGLTSKELQCPAPGL